MLYHDMGRVAGAYSGYHLVLCTDGKFAVYTSKNRSNKVALSSDSYGTYTLHWKNRKIAMTQESLNTLFKQYFADAQRMYDQAKQAPLPEVKPKYAVLRDDSGVTFSARFNNIEDAKKMAEEYAIKNRGVRYSVVKFEASVAACGVVWD